MGKENTKPKQDKSEIIYSKWDTLERSHEIYSVIYTTVTSKHVTVLICCMPNIRPAAFIPMSGFLEWELGGGDSAHEFLFHSQV